MECRNITIIQTYFSYCTFLFICISVSGCSSTPPKLVLSDNFSAPATPDELSCPETEQNRCAISSPIHDLIDEQTGQVNHLTILDIGEQALEARIHIIRSARESIELQTYIWANDETGNLIFTELLDAARRGVKVRIIADQLYSVRSAENAAKVATLHTNLQVKLYNPLLQESTSSGLDSVKGVFLDFNNLNHRMHNKVLVVDGNIGIVGGRNIENKYYDQDPHFNFIDREVLVVGPVVNKMQVSFDQYWNDPITVFLHQLKDVNQYLFTDGVQNNLSQLSMLELAIFDELSNRASDYNYIKERFIDTSFRAANVNFTADRPQKPFIKDEEKDRQTINELVDVINSAQQSLLMQTPYFILSNPAYNFLNKKRDERPGIKYIAITNSLAAADHYFVYALGFKRKKRNIKTLGFQIHELKPIPGNIRELLPNYDELLSKEESVKQGTTLQTRTPDEYERFEPIPIVASGPRVSIHAKSMVVDGKIAVVGSHNFDPRSLEINTETTLTVYDETFAQAIEESIMRLKKPENSWIVAQKETVPVLGQVSGIFGSISRMLPIFDLWPFRYSSSFELKPEMSPVPSSHPEFYNNYNDVGQFPQCALGDKQLLTYLISGFGAVAEPQM